MKFVLFASLLFLFSCEKSYQCACDADGVAPIENDIIFDVEASSKSDAREKCRHYGDECGLFPIN